MSILITYSTFLQALATHTDNLSNTQLGGLHPNCAKFNNPWGRGIPFACTESFWSHSENSIILLYLCEYKVTVFDEHERLKKYYIHMETCITIIDKGLPKFRPMLGTYMAFEQGGDLSCATPAVTWGLGFCGLI